MAKKYGVQMVNTRTGVVEETLDEIFGTEEEAEDFAAQYSSDFAAGVDYMEDAGKASMDPDEFDFEVIER